MSASATATATTDSRGWFAVPTPVKELFKLFPLQTYPAEALPYRTPARTRLRPSLYVFVDEDDALQGVPSFNPSCLKWQTFLRIAGIQVDLVPSNNHASPSGALPFLLPPSSSSSTSISISKPPTPLTGDKIYNYAKSHASNPVPEPSSPRLEAYQALLTQNIRPAWLHALYLLPTNAPLLSKLYLPSSPLLRHPLHHTLHSAATTEILKSTRQGVISPAQLYTNAADALRALSILLGDDDWFFGINSPGLFDAEVFAYTWLMLKESLSWQDDRLAKCLTQFDNLLHHRKRLYMRCWANEA